MLDPDPTARNKCEARPAMLLKGELCQGTTLVVPKMPQNNPGFSR